MRKELRGWFLRHRYNPDRWTFKALGVRLQVSRTTLYYWFNGQGEPPEEKVKILKDYLEKGY